MVLQKGKEKTGWLMSAKSTRLKEKFEALYNVLNAIVKRSASTGKRIIAREEKPRLLPSVRDKAQSTGSQSNFVEISKEYRNLILRQMKCTS